MLEFSSTNNDCGCDSGSLNGFTDPSCPSPSVVTWQSLQGKPSCFTPCAHTHVPGDIIGLEAYIQSVEFASSVTSTNSIQLTTPSGVLNANLKLSANAGTGYKVPLSILSDGLIGQIPYASGVSSGILSSSDWSTFNNKFNTPSGTILQYVRGDGSLATFPAGLPPSGVAGGELSGTYPNPSLLTTAVTGKLLSGLPLFSNTPITSADSILTAFSKIQGQINSTPSLPSFTIGSVLFGSGTGITQNNFKFFWDNTYQLLSIGSNTFIPTDWEKLYLYDSYKANIALQGDTVGSQITLKGISPTSRDLKILCGTTGASVLSSTNIPLTIGVASSYTSMVFETDGVSRIVGGIATQNHYVNVNSLTVNVAKNSNSVVINTDPIVGISSVTPLTIILPQTPYDGQEVGVLIVSASGTISLSSGEILVQGFGGTSNVINNLPETTGALSYGISGFKYKYVSNTAKWYRIY